MLTGVDRAASVLVDGSRIGTGDCFLMLNVLTGPLLRYQVFCVTEELANRETVLTVTACFLRRPAVSRGRRAQPARARSHVGAAGRGRAPTVAGGGRARARAKGSGRRGGPVTAAPAVAAKWPTAGGGPPAAQSHTGADVWVWSVGPQNEVSAE